MELWQDDAPLFDEPDYHDEEQRELTAVEMFLYHCVLHPLRALSVVVAAGYVAFAVIWRFI